MGLDRKQTGIQRTTLDESRKEIPNVAVFLKRSTLEFLQILFSTREKGHLQYRDDENDTDIQITDQHAVDLEAWHTRPAIVGVRGPLSWQGLGLGGNALEKQNRLTGQTTHNDLLTGSMAFSCISREGTEAENIAHLVFNSFKAFRPELAKYGFFTIKSLNIGSETLVVQDGAHDDLYIVPVYITAQIQDRWTLDDKAAKRLRQIIFETEIHP